MNAVYDFTPGSSQMLPKGRSSGEVKTGPGTRCCSQSALKEKQPQVSIKTDERVSFCSARPHGCVQGKIPTTVAEPEISENHTGEVSSPLCLWVAKGIYEIGKSSTAPTGSGALLPLGSSESSCMP